MRPGMVLMRRLNLPVKLALVALSLLIPLAVMVGWAVHGLVEQRALAIEEQAGLGVAERLMALVVETQKHRGLTNRVLAGEASASASRDDTRKALREAVAAMDAHLASSPSYSLDDDWLPLRRDLLALAEGRHPAVAAEAFDAHSAAVHRLQRLSRLNAERSGLVLDPQPRSYFLMTITVDAMLPAIESAAVARGLGAGLLARGTATPGERAAVLGHASLLARGAEDIGSSLMAYQRAGGVLPGSWNEVNEGLARQTQAIRQTFSADALAGDPRAYFEQGSAVIVSMMALRRDINIRLRGELAARIEQIERQMAWAAAGLALGLLLLGYLMLSFYLTFTGALRVLMKGTRAVAGGDLSHAFDVKGNDELSEIGHTVDRMSERLSGLVAEIRSSASRVSMAGSQVADGSSKLSQRTEEQASSLRASVQSIGELSQAVEHNAESARELDGVTERLRLQAEQAHAAMTETVQAMARMQASSQRVADVVAVIDDVAFQTSMLSLNAAVEAARAGESGKGFAVVAAEVRQLAQRCADSAEEIRGLIADAGDQVQASSDKLGHASLSLEAIVDGVRDVSGRLRQIATASTEQSAGLQEVTASIGNLDEITRNNARLVEESTTASGLLMERADALREAVVSMRLRQGSADEAQALVEKAVAHIAAVGRQQAVADFHRPDGGFIDRDLYIFCIDRAGVYTAFGSRPQFVGKSTADVPGLRGTDFVEQVWGAVETGGGWVRYEVLNPVTNAVMKKESYVVGVDGGLAMGCGVYRKDEAASGTGRQRAASWSMRAAVAAPVADAATA